MQKKAESRKKQVGIDVEKMKEVRNEAVNKKMKGNKKKVRKENVDKYDSKEGRCSKKLKESVREVVEMKEKLRNV